MEKVDVGKDCGNGSKDKIVRGRRKIEGKARQHKGGGNKREHAEEEEETEGRIRKQER